MDCKNTPCVIFPGYKNKKGYGKFKLNGFDHRPHRLMLMVLLGRCLRPGYQANHHCDNPSCINPFHLYEGTQSENVNDAFCRGRKTVPDGENASTARLTRDDVINIIGFINTGATVREIQDIFFISRASIDAIRLGTSWRKVPRPWATPPAISYSKSLQNLGISKRRGNSKYTPETIQEIRKRLDRKETGVSIANGLGVSQALVSCIKNNKIWRPDNHKNGPRPD